MKFKILVATLVAIVMSFYGTQVLAGRDAKGNGGKDNTVNVCHVTKNSRDFAFLISVPASAVKAHTGHGDVLAVNNSCEREKSDAEITCELLIGVGLAIEWIPNNRAPDYGECDRGLNPA